MKAYVGRDDKEGQVQVNLNLRARAVCWLLEEDDYKRAIRLLEQPDPDLDEEIGRLKADAQRAWDELRESTDETAAEIRKVVDLKEEVETLKGDGAWDIGFSAGWEKGMARGQSGQARLEGDIVELTRDLTQCQQDHDHMKSERNRWSDACSSTINALEKATEELIRLERANEREKKPEFDPVETDIRSGPPRKFIDPLSGSEIVLDTPEDAQPETDDTEQGKLREFFASKVPDDRQIKVTLGEPPSPAEDAKIVGMEFVYKEPAEEGITPIWHCKDSDCPGHDLEEMRGCGRV